MEFKVHSLNSLTRHTICMNYSKTAKRVTDNETVRIDYQGKP